MKMFNCSILMSKAVAGEIANAGYKSVKRADENFVIIEGTNFGVSWDEKAYCEVITNYTRDGKWYPLSRNPICGKASDCVKAAISRHEYWQRKNRVA